MKQVKMSRIMAVLNSAKKTRHIDSLTMDPADSSVMFKLSGKFYELQWDDKDMEFELVRYDDRRNFERLGLAGTESLEKLIYKSKVNI